MNNPETIRSFTLLVQEAVNRAVIDTAYLGSVDLKVHADALADRLVLDLIHHFYASGRLPTEYPANWIEALKDRWFPPFLRRWWPVKMAEAVRICPHLPVEGSRDAHLYFLTRQDVTL